MNKPKIKPCDKEFDSKEEEYFSWWLDELQEAGYIYQYKRQFPTFELSEKVEKTLIKQLKTKKKEVKRTLFQPCTYTPDFTIEWKLSSVNKFIVNVDWIVHNCALCYNWEGCDTILNPDRVWTVYVDVKPIFSIRESDKAKFSILQKWVYQKYTKYINPVVYQKLFEKTFTPKRFLLTDKTNKPRKIKWDVVTLEEYIERQ